MKLYVDSTACQAYGLCKEEAPDQIELDEWGYAATPSTDLDPVGATAAAAAVQACPVKALRLS